MEDTRFNEVMDATVSKIRELADANTVIGKPIQTPDGITVIPISRVTLGFGTGGTSGSKGISFTGGNGGGVKVEPIGFFVIKDGNCRMISEAEFDKIVAQLTGRPLPQAPAQPTPPQPQK